MLRAVIREQLAEWCDVFCEEGVFTPDESRQHPDGRTRCRSEAEDSRRRARAERRVAGRRRPWRSIGRSSDIHRRSRAPAALATAGVVATLLPIASFYLKLGRYAPGRLLIAQDVPVALATDVNPGGGFSPSMPFAMTLACFGMGLTFEEALVAATINAAYAIDRHDRIGSLEVGKQMDAVIVDGPAIDLIRVGTDTIHAVVKKGKLVAMRGQAARHAWRRAGRKLRRQGFLCRPSRPEWTEGRMSCR